jgi:uncharacterized NAD(P)/FAD-binding protein YdhS
MPPIDFTSLVNIGAAGAVIAVVVVFLKFIEKRDQDWRDFFNGIRATDGAAITRLTEVIDRLVSRVESLEGKFDAHDAKEMEFLRGVQDRKTQPRSHA